MSSTPATLLKAVPPLKTTNAGPSSPFGVAWCRNDPLSLWVENRVARAPAPLSILRARKSACTTRRFKPSALYKAA